MAGNQININLTVSDQGNTIKQRTKDAENLNTTLSKAAQSAQRAMSGFGGKGEGTEYGRARGIAETTGASARDFANQAQGLGGLVRVYATVAANIFAATAAFNALKEAANTAAMVEGLNQLGARSGIALGTLSNKFAEATGNAISLREAMGSVAKASAAGLGSNQILEIAKFAKTASQALGVDMTDAVNRLTRGIVKLEPELLDELGLFTKIGPATEKYAASLGRSVSSLTDFERRQAFANAVLEEARQKFGSIALEANPYQKLEANIRNLTTATLDLVNTVLGPIVGLLSNSSVALGGVFTLLALKLTNMAIPAIKSWRGELVQAAVDAKEKAKNINESFGEIFVQRTVRTLQIPQATEEVKKEEAEFNRLRKQFVEQDNNIRNKSRSVILNSLKDEAALSTNISKIRKDITARENAGGEANKKHAETLKQMLASYEKMLQARAKLTALENQAERAFSASSAEESQRLRISQQAGARAERLAILSQVGGNVEAGGVRFALQQLEADLNKAVDLKGWAALRTKATGWAIAGAAAVGVFLRSINVVTTTILAAVGAFFIFDSVLSKNTDQMNELNSQLKQNESSLKTASGVLQLYGDSLRATAIEAKSNAIGQLSNDLDSFVTKLQDTIQAQGAWDKFKDKVLGVFGFGVADDFAESTAKLLVKQIDLLPEGELRESIERKLAEVFSVTQVTAANIEKSLQGGTADQATRQASKANQIIKEGVGFYKDLQSSLAGVDEAAKNADLRLSEIVQSLSNQDPVSKFAASFLTLGFSVKKAASESLNAVAAMDKLLSKPRTLELLEIGTAARVETLRSSYIALQSQQTTLQKQLTTSTLELSVIYNQSIASMTEEQIKARQALIQSLEEKASTIKVQLVATNVGLRTLENQLNKIIEGITVKSFKLMESVVKNAIDRANLGIRRNLLEGVTGPGVAQAVADITIKDISLQKENNSLLSRLNNTLIRANVLKEVELAQKTIEDLGKSENIVPGSVEEKRLRDAQATVALGPELLEAINRGGMISAQRITQLPVNLQGSAVQYSQANQARREKEAQLNAQTQQVIDTARIASIKELQDLETILQQQKQKTLDLDTKLYNTTIADKEVLSDIEITNKQIFELKKLQQDTSLSTKVLNDEIALLDERRKIATDRGYKNEIALLTRLINLKSDQKKELEEQAEKESKLLAIQQAQFRIANNYSKLRAERDQEVKISEILRDIDSDRLSNQLELINIRAELGKILPEEQRLQELSLRTQILENERVSQVVKLAQQANNEIAEVDKQRLQAAAAAALDGISIDDSYYQNRIDRINQIYALDIERIQQTTEARKAQLNLQLGMSTQMKGYDQIFRSSIDRMSDSIVEFAKTGKLNFKDMINSMLEDILRFELRQQTLKTYQGLGGAAGIFDFAARLAFNTPSIDQELGFAPFKAAKGMMLDGGVQQFAKGGMFTNQIVSQPTLFKFAQGTGLMGEAGPEAIMPLKRDQNGNLGVRSTQQNVEVVVNNYSNQQAETKETVDSRGNRKIEVVIGDMVAGEMGRKNSSVQQSLAQNFSTRPSIVRR
jgi:lambda family phage tail tape measure protein